MVKQGWGCMHAACKLCKLDIWSSPAAGARRPWFERRRGSEDWSSSVNVPSFEWKDIGHAFVGLFTRHDHWWDREDVAFTMIKVTMTADDRPGRAKAQVKEAEEQQENKKKIGRDG
ncbi:hypothetical protein M406DRAFT_327222 [Cryphonectria parasitica EP155]|uniref:Uncharacterized protein n=1 Tax=Cryphonectria parasitica (strain ATCC 38755 / EP155) TaxID=660469 RepID=A0A9P4Y962_CRYP1|nr:uncharacterized protein M406DRAFT_327222 [Cryphonectria parasitica EP155]KAF3768803.1 hypothetical protein M406DRAFT_327222 [Cryphonectria parasitica EP155]